MPSPPPRASRRALVAPALLVALALAQLGGWRCAALSPWKGGGFGMFATNDHGALPDRAGAGALRRGRKAGRAARASSTACAATCASCRARRTCAASPRRSARATPGLGALRVEVWRTEFSHADLEPRLVLVARGERL